MKKKRLSSGKKILLFFGIVFIFGGFSSSFTEISGFIKKNTAAYKKEVVCDVISVKTEEDLSGVPETRNINRTTTYYITEEEADINGQTVTFKKRYPYDPGGSIKHTVISDNGVDWVICDSSPHSIATASVLGLILLVVGIGLIVMAVKHS